MLIFSLVLALLLFLATAAFTFLWHLINNRSVSLITKNPNYQTPKNVLAVFAHPDDEVMVAGTLLKWKAQGAELHLLYLTHGEDGPTGGLVDKSLLAQKRATELESASKIMQASNLSILSFPDRSLASQPPQQVEAAIHQALTQHKPDTVICFDDTIGLYGHSDHAFSGLCTQRLLRQNPGTVRQLFVMTLGPNMLALALKISKTFRERYSPENGLPPANAAVSIAPLGRLKKQVVQAHATQWQVMQDVQPYYNKLPFWLYYRIFSREYFHFSLL